jgi:hypothetical protein
VCLTRVSPIGEGEAANNIPTVGLNIEFTASMGDELTRMREVMNGRAHFSMFPLWTVRMALILDSNIYMALTVIFSPLTPECSSKTPKKGLRDGDQSRLPTLFDRISVYDRLLSAVWISVRGPI